MVVPSIIKIHQTIHQSSVLLMLWRLYLSEKSCLSGISLFSHPNTHARLSITVNLDAADLKSGSSYNSHVQISSPEIPLSGFPEPRPRSLLSFLHVIWLNFPPFWSFKVESFLPPRLSISLFCQPRDQPLFHPQTMEDFVAWMTAITIALFLGALEV